MYGGEAWPSAGRKGWAHTEYGCRAPSSEVVNTISCSVRNAQSNSLWNMAACPWEEEAPKGAMSSVLQTDLHVLNTKRVMFCVWNIKRYYCEFLQPYCDVWCWHNADHTSSGVHINNTCTYAALAVHFMMLLWTLQCIFLFHAGPFRFVDSYGAGNLLNRINRFREVYGDHFTPAPMLEDFAKDPTKKFHPK